MAKPVLNVGKEGKVFVPKTEGPWEDREYVEDYSKYDVIDGGFVLKTEMKKLLKERHDEIQGMITGAMDWRANEKAA